MKKLIRISLAVAAVLMLLAGCELFSRSFYLSEEDFPDPTKGAVLLTFREYDIATKTIAPGDMVVHHYYLDFTGPAAGNNFVVPDAPAASGYAKMGLAPGAWKVAIQAKDSGNLTLGAIDGDLSVKRDFYITAGAINTVGDGAAAPGESTDPAIRILPVTKPTTGPDAVSGTLGALVVAYPLTSITPPVTIAAYLVPAGETGLYTNFPIQPSFSGPVEGATKGTFTYAATSKLPGYYTLAIQLFGNGVQAWGWAESVRVVYSKSTSTTLDLMSTSTGGLTLVVETDMQMPIAITLYGHPTNNTAPATSITTAQSMYLRASFTQAPGYSYAYKWYRDGLPLDTPTTGEITSGGFTPGDHSLCVVVTETATVGGAIRTISSQGHNFQVTAQ